MNKLKSQKGFTLLELVFYMTLSSIIFVVATAVLATQLEIFSNVNFRQTALANMRYGLDHMSQELLRVNHSAASTTITSISATHIDFTDRDGIVTNFRQAANGSEQAIYRGNDVLVSPIQSLRLQYYDQAGTEITDMTNITAIRRIKVTITSDEQSDEGTLVVTNTVTPRSLIYENYQ